MTYFSLTRFLPICTTTSILEQVKVGVHTMGMEEVRLWYGTVTARTTGGGRIPVPSTLR